MALSNWIELSALLLILTAGLIIWLLCRKKLSRYDGVEGFITERGKLPARRKLDIEEEIERLEALLERDERE
ncbi:MAG: hypothetical protein FWH26_06260 [Oscillospiraceae bacterium]|nr:hypothetical protein [Oscillospiraceae bacterium]